MNIPGTHTGRRLLAIEGPIGAGKTTLARIVARALGAKLVLEQFEENPFLELFYADLQRYAWPTQLHFLVDRCDQLTELPDRGMLVGDYMFAKDRIFAALTLSAADLQRYTKVYTALAAAVPAPDWVVYLRADADTLLSRIGARARPYERRIERSYLEALTSGYDRFFSGYQAAPLLRIDTAALNVADNDAQREQVLLLIRELLAGT
jgi:deoxyadenosine/deoxycytidine kinase